MTYKDNLHNHTGEKCTNKLCCWSKHSIKISTPRIEKKKIKRLVNQAEILEMYLWHKMTLEQIGKIKKLTKERIRQILSKFPCYFEERKRRMAEHHPIVKCEYCKKTYSIFVNSSNENCKHYCSWDCRLKDMYGKDYISIRKDNYNKRMLLRYHTVFKSKPNWREIVRERNLRAKLKRDANKPSTKV